MKVIGLDPGSRFAGYGVISLEGPHPRHLEHGVVRIPETLTFAERLGFLAKELRPIWIRHPGAATVVEKIFLGRNADSAFKLGHARGVCLLLAAEARAEVFEYAARQVKKVVTGQGNASKEHVQLVVNQLLQVRIDVRADASDALAMALCHARKLTEARLFERCEAVL